MKEFIVSTEKIPRVASILSYAERPNCSLCLSREKRTTWKVDYR